MLNITFKLIKGLLELAMAAIKILGLPVLLVVFTFFVLISINLLIFRLDGTGVPKIGSVKKLKKRNFFQKLFIDAPYRFAMDKIEKPADFFDPQGMVIFTGFQGSGKTSALIQYTLELQEQYPCSVTLGNLGYKKQKLELDDWRKLTTFKNAKKGVIVQMDETQNWFSSKQSGNFPPEMLAVVTQNRKNRRLLLGTAQSFYMLAKDIRTQCTEERKCTTWLGCITIVHRVQHTCDGSGEIKNSKSLGWYWFVHNDMLRYSYDTYHVIESLTKADFKEKKPKEEVNVNVVST